MNLLNNFIFSLEMKNFMKYKHLILGNIEDYLMIK